MIKFILVLFLVNLTQVAIAQYGNTKKYPQGYFIYPVKAAVGLNANFGELRPNHWHMGLDCKTEKRENVDLVAAADGYIAKIKVEPWGFGRAIYVNHPNGYTTLYAHCNDFYPELEKWVKQEQYKRKSWKVFLDSIPANLFPVKKGQFIAKSGNTGGSLGPHLHFEIRDTKSDKVLNPLLFGFNIADNVKPVVTKVVVYDRCQSVFEQTPKIINVSSGAVTPINIKTEQVSFAIAANDAVSGNPNPNGIYQATVYDNGVALCGFQMDSISYDETRFLNAHIDYKMKANGGSYVQHISALPGNKNGVYKEFKNDGIVNLMDGKPHLIKIEVKDAAGNVTVLQFNIINKSIANTRCNDSIAANAMHHFLPRTINYFEKPFFKFKLDSIALYDSIVFKYAAMPTKDANAYSDLHIAHTASVPVHSYSEVWIKANKNTATVANRLIIKQYLQGAKFEVFKPQMQGEWFTAKTRNFGKFLLLHDSKPPVITPSGISNGANLSKAKGFSFTIIDEHEELKNFKATIDGEWVLFSNDKGKVFKHIFDEKTAPGSHSLVVYVEDIAGNSTTQTYNFTR
jgi:hypothetical protein